MSVNRSAISVSVSPTLSDRDREELSQIFVDNFDVLDQGKKFTGAEWAIFIVVMKDVGTIAGTVNALVVLAGSIKKWREKLRAAGKSPNVQFRRRASVLDLSTATDAEIEQWVEGMKRDQEAI